MTSAGTRVLICAGGSGGHIRPGLAVAAALTASGATVLWCGDDSPLVTRLVQGHYPLFAMTLRRGRGGGSKRLLLVAVTLPIVIWRCVRLLRRERIDVVVGMGGFASFPGAVAARLCRRRLIVHEQNSVMGLANRLLSRIATVTCVAFATASSGKRVVVTGNPVAVQPTVAATRAALQLLVLGGSQGASALNAIVPPALVALAMPLRVLHQSGGDKALAQQILSVYRANGISAEVTPFIDQMQSAYDAADIVIARAGAMTVAEVLTTGIAAVFIPYPYAVDDHQYYNAEAASALVAPGRISLLREQQLTPQTLAAAIQAVLPAATVRQPQQLHRDAAATIAAVALATQNGAATRD